MGKLLHKELTQNKGAHLNADFIENLCIDLLKNNSHS